MKLAKFFRVVLVAVLASCYMTGVARADMIATDQVVEKYAVQADKAYIQEMLKRADVRAELENYGVDPAEAEQRIAAMTDAEIRDVAMKLETEPAGAGDLGTVLGVALTVFLVLLLTDILCLTDVFSFTRCARE